MINKVDFLILKRLKQEPFYGLRLLVAVARGTFYIFYYKIIYRNVRIQFPFKAFAKTRIIGPGSVTIGRNCSVYKSVFKGLTIVTYAPESSVVIGCNCNLQGITIRSHNRVEIAEKCMSAYCLVQDSPFVCLDTNQKKTSIHISKPINIGGNVWLGGHSGVMGGSTIGSDSVIGAGSWCYSFTSKDNSLIIGNPAKRALPIQNLLNYLGEE